MSELCSESFRCNPQELRQAMAIHTRKITDSCRDKDCVEDLRVYLTASSQQTLEGAANVRVRSGELLYAYVDVQNVAFDRNHYCVDITFYYRILADAVVGTCRPAALSGLATFSKRAVLCGEDSRAHIFTSGTTQAPTCLSSQSLPTAIVEVLDPMVLSSRVREAGQGGCPEAAAIQIPPAIQAMFDEELVLTGSQRLFVTLGQFSIVRLERDVQLIVPVVEYAMPIKECADGSGCCPEDPCELFSRIPFPAQQFAPRGCDQESGSST